MNNLPVKYKISALLIILLIFLSIVFHRSVLVILNQHTSIFKIKNIDVQGSVFSSDTQFQNNLDSVLDKSLLTLNLFSFKQKLIQHSMIDDIIITKNFPNKLIINVIEKKPVAIILNDNQKYTIDPLGNILPMTIDSIPKITIDFGLIIDNNKINDKDLIEMFHTLNDPVASSIESIYINKNRDTRFRLKGLKSDFLISKRILSVPFINRALEILETIKNKKIKEPKEIDIYSNSKNAIGFL